MKQITSEEIIEAGDRQPALSPLPRRMPRWFNTEFWLAFVILNFTLLIYFSTPIFTPNSYYLAAEALQKTDNLLYDMPPYPKKDNIGFVDPLKYFQPQLFYSLERIKQGEFPLWNPYSGNGMPHLGSLQSAIFSPFSVPVYLFGIKNGWLLSHYLKLLVVGLFTYGYLRTIRLYHWIALGSAIAATYSGYIIIWHTGPHIPSIVVLPAGMFFVERAVQATTNRGRVLNLIGLAGAVASGIVGGHIEGAFFATLFVAFYIVYRVWFENGVFWVKVRRSAVFAFFGLLGVGLSAVQLLPFVEYMLRWVGSGRAHPRIGIPDNMLIFNIFPTSFGYAGQPFVADPGGRTAEVFLPHVGAFFVFLVPVGLIIMRREKLFWFFAFATLFFFGYIYNLFPFDVWVSNLPIFRESVAQRGSFCVNFGLSCLGGLVLNHLYTQGWNWRRRVAFVGGALLFIFTALGAVNNTWTIWKVDTAAKGFQNYVPYQLLYTCIVFAIGVLAALLLVKNWLRFVGVALLLVVCFAQSGWLFKDINATSSQSYAYPSTEGTRALQTIARQDSIAFYHSIYLTPLANQFYDLYDIRFFDAMYVPNYETLLTNVYGVKERIHRVLQRITPHGLKLFGVQYVASTWLPDAVVGQARPEKDFKQPLPVAEGRVLEQTFVAEHNNLTTISVLTGAYGQRYDNTCHLDFTLTEVSQPQQPVRTKKLSCSIVPEGDYLNITFEPLPQSQGKTYRFTLASPDSTLTNKVAVFLSTQPLPGASFRVSGEPTGWTAIFQHLYTPPNSAYTPVWDNGRFNIYRFNQAVPRYYSVGTTLKPQNDGQTMELIMQQKFEPSQVALLSPESTLSPLEGGESSQAKVLIEKPEYKKLEVTRQSPGLLVTSLTNFPGWKVRLDGKEVPVVRTNYAFIGAPLPAGTHQIEIVYDPLSFKLGVAASLLSLLLLVALAVWFWKERRPLPWLGRFKTF